MAFVPKEAEGVSNMSKYSEFKPIVSTKTPLSMMQSHPDASNYLDAHKHSSGGVVPGYAGHVPKARDTFGSSAVGGLAPEAHIGIHKHMGVMSGHESQAYGSKRVAGPLGAGPLANEKYAAFSEKKGGVMPGYAGFRPGARDHYGDAAYGGIKREGSGEGANEALKAGWDDSRGGPGVDYKGVVSGLVPGYTGHVPEAINKHGTSHFGGIVPGAQLGHEHVRGDHYTENDVGMRTKSGYSGHVPRARDAFGTSTCDPK
jgi:hypothetical protein